MGMPGGPRSCGGRGGRALCARAPGLQAPRHGARGSARAHAGDLWRRFPRARQPRPVAVGAFVPAPGASLQVQDKT